MKTTIENELTGSEKVLYNATYKFAIQTGENEIEARNMAINKVLKTRKLSKSLKFKF
jgi:hypothetical protein